MFVEFQFGWTARHGEPAHEFYARSKAVEVGQLPQAHLFT